MVAIKKKLLFIFVIVLILTISVAAAVLTIKKASSVVRVTDAVVEETQQPIILNKFNIRASSVVKNAVEQESQQPPIPIKAKVRASSITKARERPAPAAEAPTEELPAEVNIPLAETVSGISMNDDPYIAYTYLPKYNYFSDLQFEEVTDAKTVVLKHGNAPLPIAGFILGEKKYAVHLVGCNREEATCSFRISGILVRDMHEGYSIYFDGQHNMKINAVALNICDDREVCDYLYRNYDRVDVGVNGNGS